jgi:hypothetical protein
MNNIRSMIVAAAVISVMAAGATSASAAVTVSPAGAHSITFPSGGYTMSFIGAGFTANCPPTMATNITASGAVTVSSFVLSPVACGGYTWTFHTPWSGQISGSPGNYAALIPASFKTKNAYFTCEYNGTLRLPLTSGNTHVGTPSGWFAATITSTPVACPGPNIQVSGNGGTISPAVTITGSL